MKAKKTLKQLEKEVEEWKEKYYDLLGAYKQEGEYLNSGR